MFEIGSAVVFFAKKGSLSRGLKRFAFKICTKNLAMADQPAQRAPQRAPRQEFTIDMRKTAHKVLLHSLKDGNLIPGSFVRVAEFFSVDRTTVFRLFGQNISTYRIIHYMGKQKQER